ncbi:MAG: D-alanyl-D-alanine carboxypeptidase, partial [Chloroflexia bacterium]
MYSYVRCCWRLLVAGLLIILALAPGAGGLALAAPLAQVVTEPEISARAAIVVEYPSGRILYSRGAHDRLAPASTTKILTAILATEYGKLQDIVTIADSDLVGESSMGLV